MTLSKLIGTYEVYEYRFLDVRLFFFLELIYTVPCLITLLSVLTVSR